jgi:hypothetical protein
MHGIVQRLSRATLAGLTDRELLVALVTRRDEVAFEALLRRHGPLVLSVCRRVLRNDHDADDAFQATFLVFVRKAAHIRKSEAVVDGPEYADSVHDVYFGTGDNVWREK